MRVRSIEVVRLLIDTGADVNYKTEDRKTALHVATHNPSAEMTDVLLKAGAEIDIQTKHTKDTPLHLAAQHGSMEVVRSLLKAGSSITLKGWKNRTAEGWARAYGHKEIAKLLHNFAKSKVTM